MAHSGRILENKNVEENIDSGGSSHEVSQGNKDSFRNCTGEHLYCVLAIVYPSLETE